MVRSADPTQCRENWFYLLIAALMLWNCAAFAAGPATAPAPAPATQPASDDAHTARIRKRVGGLVDRDAAVRDSARDILMGLSSSKLPSLKRVVQQSLPLQPGQQAVLHDIVTQIFLAGLPYESDPMNPSRGFLGIRFDTDQNFLDFGLGGLEVRNRLPGFCAFRSLRDNDVIRAIVSDPVIPIRSPEELTMVIPQFRAGQSWWSSKRCCRRKCDSHRDSLGSLS